MATAVLGWKSILAIGVATSMLVLASKLPFEKAENALHHMINAFSLKHIVNKQ